MSRRRLEALALELQNAVTQLVVEILGARTAVTPSWLMRPGKGECGERWALVQRVYAELTGGAELPETMPERESRRVDCVLVVDDEHRILEVDQNNRLRAVTLGRYASEVPLAFRANAWIAASDAKKHLEGGGFAKPRPLLFPADGGRHQQRAFRDALADILPGVRGWLPPSTSAISK